MFNNFPSYLRLLICLFLSAGAHGGVALYDMMTIPGESRLSAAPVNVALLTAADTVPPSMAPSPKPQQVTPASRNSGQAFASVQTSPKAKVPPAAVTPAARSKGSLPAVAQEQPRADSPVAEMACMAPQDAFLEEASMPSAAIPTAMSGAETAEAPGGQEAAAANALSGSRAKASRDLVDAVPNYSSNPLPEYPPVARRKHWQGVVWLLVDVSDKGLVKELRVEQSCGHSVLDRAASRTVKRWRFTPASRAGIPAASQVRIPVRFRLEDS
jgi:protein TonB